LLSGPVTRCRLKKAHHKQPISLLGLDMFDEDNNLL
jgi:hypothetical protein